MTFEFVSHNDITDGATRKRIRSHVAKGKNVGKKLVRASKTKALGLKRKKTTATALISIPSSKGAVGAKACDDGFSVIEHPIGHTLFLLPFQVPFPGQSSPQSTGLIQKAMSFIRSPRWVPELHKALDVRGFSVYSSIFFQFLFLDEAYFHCGVATAVKALVNLGIQQEDRTEVLRHLSHTFRLINERLSGKDGVTNTTIAAVLSMTYYERMQRQYRQGFIHVGGLQQMVKLRGGIASFMESEPYLAFKIMGVDLDTALLMGKPTRFTIDDVDPSGAIVSWLWSSFVEMPLALDTQFLDQLSFELQALLVDSIGFAWLVNEGSTSKREKMNGGRFHETFLLLGYRLVHISPIGRLCSTNPLDKAVHLGLAAFITSLSWGLDYRTAYNPHLPELINLTVKAVEDRQECQHVIVWILFIAGACLFEQQPDDIWLISKIARITRGLGLNNWEDVRKTLAKFPWVHIIHDKAGEAIWHKSTSYR